MYAWLNIKCILIYLIENNDKFIENVLTFGIQIDQLYFLNIFLIFSANQR